MLDLRQDLGRSRGEHDAGRQMLYCADEPSARTSDHGKDRAWENRRKRN